MNEDEYYLKKVTLTDKACFKVSGKVNCHNVRIWSCENPHVVIENICDSPTVNVWCGLLHDHSVGPFFFVEDTVTSKLT